MTVTSGFVIKFSIKTAILRQEII